MSSISRPRMKKQQWRFQRIIFFSFIFDLVSLYFITQQSSAPELFSKLNKRVDSPQFIFQPTTFYRHIQLRHWDTADDNNSSDVRISWQLHDAKDLPLSNTFNTHECPLGELMNQTSKTLTGEIRDGVLPPFLLRVMKHKDSPRNGRVLDFTATISTNLKLLFIGDSVIVQLAEAFHEMVGDLQSRTQLAEAWEGNVGRSIVSPTIGGGVSALWRMTGLLSMSREGWPPANKPGGGWTRDEIASFLNHKYVSTKSDGAQMSGYDSRRRRKERNITNNDNSQIHSRKRPTLKDFCGTCMFNGQNYNCDERVEWVVKNKKMSKNKAKMETLKFCVNPGARSGERFRTVDKFDAVIFRVMHGWMSTDEITHARLVEAIELAHELLGAETVLLMTVPFTNNVLTIEEMNRVNQINKDIRDIARGWHLRNRTTGVKHVLVIEYETYYNHIIWSNARHIGYNVSAPLMMTKATFDMEGPNLLLDRLQNGEKWKPSIPMVCSELKSLGADRAKCNRNLLFSDGQHICTDSLASRFGVASACLLGCVYNHKDTGNNHHYQQQQQPNNVEKQLRACERECNEQFMSVMPVDETWLVSDTLIRRHNRSSRPEMASFR